MQMKCPRPECGWEWKPKVASPRACPYCKRYLPRDDDLETLKAIAQSRDEFEARDDEPEAIYNNIPDDSDLPRDEDYCQDCGAILADCKCEIMFGGSIPTQPTHCPDCKNPIPECECVDDGIELTEKGDTRK